MSSNKQQEQSFSILPHPAKTNNPADLAGGPQSSQAHAGKAGAFHARDPHVPSEDVWSRVEQPKTREELRARAAELNSGK